MNNDKGIRIPKRYYDDHRDCVSEFETPRILRSTKSHYYIDNTPSPDWDEFVSRCEFYAADSEYGPNVDDCWPIVFSARATLKALNK